MAAEPTSEELRRFYDERSKVTKKDRFQIDKQGNLAEYDTERAGAQILGRDSLPISI